MKRSIGLWQLIGFAFTSLCGTLLHFLYEWLDNPLFIAPFSGVNESTWEHMKLLFWPMLIFAVIERFFFRDKDDFWCVKLRGILLGLFLIPIIFYLYNGIIGKSPDWFNIAIFFIAGAVTYAYEAWLFKKGTILCENPKIPITLLSIIAAMFAIFTFITPHIAIFKDPILNSYGI